MYICVSACLEVNVHPTICINKLDEQLILPSNTLLSGNNYSPRWIFIFSLW